MLRLLHSIFGGERQGQYPESLVKEAIERTVDGTDSWLRGVSGYRRKLRPAVVAAIDHVVNLVDSLPSPVPLSPARYGDDRLMKRFFISPQDMKQVLTSDRTLARFKRELGGDSPRIIALLAMERQERQTLGAALSGETVLRDTPLVTVCFDRHRFLDPTGDEGETRRMLKRRAFDHLIGLALRQLGDMKSERRELERRRTLLQAKLNLLEREGWSLHPPLGAEGVQAADVEEQLGRIESQLGELGGDDRMLEEYLKVVAQVLGSPEAYLWARTETIHIDRMGIKRQEAADDAPPLELHMLHNSEGRREAVLLVTLESGELP